MRKSARMKLCCRPPVYCDPRTYPAVKDRFYRNNGDGTFTDASRESGVAGVRVPVSERIGAGPAGAAVGAADSARRVEAVSEELSSDGAEVGQ